MREIRYLYNSLLTKGSFVQNVGFTSSGKIVVMSLSFIFVPVLSRLYAPEAYGNFALYNSITSIIVMLTLMGYPNAYTLIKSKKEFLHLIIFQMISIVFISIFSIIPLFAIAYYSKEYKGLLWYLPAGIIINGFIGIFSNWMIRNKDFRISAALEGGGEILIRLINLSIGFFGGGYKYGLIIGNMSGRAVANSINYFRFCRKEGAGAFYSLKLDSLKQVLFEWRKYPKFVLPSQLIQQFGSQIPIYFLAAIYGNEELGYFSMALTLFNIPVQLFSNAITPVFLQKAHELHLKGLQNLRNFTSKLVIYCQVLIFIPLLILIVFSEEIIPFFLGDNWESTAVVISISSLYVFLEILFSPLSSLFQVLKQERILFYLSLISLGFIISGLTIAAFFNLPFYQSIVIITGVKAFSYVLQGIQLFKFLQLSFLRLVGFGYGLILITFIITSILRT